MDHFFLSTPEKTRSHLLTIEWTPSFASQSGEIGGGFMSRLRMWQVWMAMVVLSTGLAVVPGVAADSTKTFTGKVSDAMCGAKHMEGGIAPAACVRVCVQKGAKYALVVGDKVYTLETSNKTALDELNKLAWEQAKVTGTASGDTISVKSVTAAK
jgi:hypothetical protein